MKSLTARVKTTEYKLQKKCYLRKCQHEIMKNWEFQPKIQPNFQPNFQPYFLNMTRHLSSRISSLRYDAARDCTPATKLTKEQKTLRATLLHLDKICEYCRVNQATTKDHFYSVIVDGYPSTYCNDLWNIVPCCKECNSSKGGKNWRVWLEGSSKGNPMLNKTSEQKSAIMEKLQNYDDIMNKYCQKKNVSKEWFDEMMDPINAVIAEAQQKIARLVLDATSQS